MTPWRRAPGPRRFRGPRRRGRAVGRPWGADARVSHVQTARPPTRSRAATARRPPLPREDHCDHRRPVTPVSTADAARRLGVGAAAVSGMLTKSADMGLVVHVPCRGVCLRDAGWGAALSIVRRHRLLETHLAGAPELSWDRVHAEAEVREQALSPELEAVIDTKLGHRVGTRTATPFQTGTGGRTADLLPVRIAGVRRDLTAATTAAFWVHESWTALSSYSSATPLATRPA